MFQPKVIFFDAVGTLFGVRGSVGEAYGTLAQQFGVNANPAQLNRAFFACFKAREQAAFPGVETREIPRLEFEWWEAIATDTFKRAGVFGDFADFSAFFAALYAYFATKDPWFVYPEVRSTLASLRSKHIELGVISNFDSRLYPVLEALDLAEFFSSVTISTQVGAAKPDPHIFATALAKHGCTPEEAWHIGDSYRDDYEGAMKAQMRGIWLQRES
ncbi:HAD-IA family hydrolase [Phormidium sp. CCY1219]|uniref:HAD-IA family hydrolase n=1 Tax=Phormidium sp. CCY1219 TaxID=2886104 RepID=UPI002D1E4CB3|nr:HAD family hydrolase [Phormidium sp. CCY1219]MEB3827267.1 HAD family hydrolase [Phormidium sp. CCY1219]